MVLSIFSKKISNNKLFNNYFYVIIPKQGNQMSKNRLKIGLSILLFATVSLTANEKYTMEQIYNKMCIECHSSDGSGNTDKLTPSMIGQSLKDIKTSLVDVENDDGHIIMEHNRGEILKMGMEYSADDMAQYMYNRFKK